MRTTLKVKPLSDLHTEFGEYAISPAASDKDTVLVLAGDIGIVHKPSQLEVVYGPFLERCSYQFKHVMLVMGNHEHYGGSFYRTQSKLQEELDRRSLSNVHILERSSVVVDDVAFIGATLWTDCDNNSPHATYLWNGMSDSRLIRTGSPSDPYRRKFMSTDVVSEHVKSKDYINLAVAHYKEQGLKTIVVVHHGVTNKSIADEFKGDSLNMFFVSDLTLDLMDMNPDIVIHGHTHSCLNYLVDDTQQICQTRVICNPRGYVGHENTGFDESLILEV